MSGTSSQVLNDGGELCLLELAKERSDCLSLERSSFALPKTALLPRTSAAAEASLLPGTDGQSDPSFSWLHLK